MLAFAIVIPNLDQSHFLPTALESLIYQREPFKLAVMDGGSTDNFDEVIKVYSENIAHLRSGPDKGQSDAIREGLNKIPGDIVAWLNADDYYFPNTFEKVAKCFETNPDVEVVYGDAIHVNPEGIFLSYFPHTQQFSPNKIANINFICQPTCFVRRTAYERIGGLDSTLHYTMDWDLWCRLSNSGANFYYLHEVLAAVRYYPGTKTLSGDMRRYREFQCIEKKYGHRIFPRSWLRAYFYDRSYSQTTGRFEKFGHRILDSLRHIKRKILNIRNILSDKNTTYYGFYPLDTLVDGCGTIHLPWYDQRKWSAIRLKVHPETDNYQVEINGCRCQDVCHEDGYLWIKLPRLETSHRAISIFCKNTKQWRLFEFDCKFENNGNKGA